ncbi:MAG: thioredoxin [archaeon]
MSENTIELNENNFDKETKKGKWIVDFWAEWCGPCKIMGPHFDSAAKDLRGKVNFGKVDVDSNSDLAGRFEVMSIPSIIFFEDGEVVHAAVGSMSKEQILELADNSFDQN